MNFGDGKGGTLPDDRMEAVRRAFAAFRELTPFERGYVTCWFCPHCLAHCPASFAHACDFNRIDAKDPEVRDG